MSRCAERRGETGLVVQTLAQFHPADRPALAASQALDRGPEVIAVVPKGPAAEAGMRPGDVILTIDGTPPPPDTDLAAPFDAAQARARLDAVDALLSGGDAPDAAPRSRSLSLLRRGATTAARVTPRPACASRVHLARSDQRNAFADGRHVFLTTGLLSRLGGDDEVAFVIAHEMAHNILHHAALTRGGADVRPLERAADALGGELMLDAGYDPVAGVEALRRLGGLHAGGAGSHDATDERIAAMRRLAADSRATRQ